MNKMMKRLVAAVVLVLCLSAFAMPSYAATALEKKAAKVVDAQVTAEMTDTEKLQTLFTWAEENMNYSRIVGFNSTAKGWEKKAALSMLKSKNGLCYHFAAAYAFLAKKAVGCPVRVCTGKTYIYPATKKTGQDHAWVEVKVGGTWYVCDPNGDKYAAQSSGKYFMKKASSKAMKKAYATGKKAKKVTVKF